MKKIYDCIVVGLGAMGSAALYQLSKRGKKVLGLDKHSPPHTHGSTHGGSRVTRQAYYEGAEYVPLLKRSYELWEQIGQDIGQQLLTITGGLNISTPETEIARLCLKAAQTYDIPYEWLTAQDLRKRFPQFRVDDSRTEALLDLQAGILKPEAGVSAHLELAQINGAELRLQEEVVKWEEMGNGLEVSTAKGTYLCTQLIICPGPWAGPLAQEFGLALHIDRIAQFWMRPHTPIRDYYPDRFPLFLWKVEPELEFYGFPAIEGPGGGVKVSFYPYGPHPVRELCTPETIRRTVDQRDEQHIRTYIEKYLPDLNHQVVRTVTCMHTNTPDYHPVIAAHPHHPNLFAAFGFSGHGFKFSNVVGELMADLVIEGKSDWQLDLFRPTRSSLNIEPMN